jgi:hypothetical protein
MIDSYCIQENPYDDQAMGVSVDFQTSMERNLSASPSGLSSYSIHSFILSGGEERLNGYPFLSMYPCNWSCNSHECTNTPVAIQPMASAFSALCFWVVLIDRAIGGFILSTCVVPPYTTVISLAVTLAFGVAWRSFFLA